MSEISSLTSTASMFYSQVGFEKLPLSGHDRHGQEASESPPPPIPQYDVFLAPPRPDYRTLANDVLENEVVRPLMRHSSALNDLSIRIEELQSLLHEKLKNHLGDSIPKPTFWLFQDRAKMRPQSVVQNSGQTFAVGRIGCQQNHMVLYRAAKTCILDKTEASASDWKEMARVEACSDVSVEPESGALSELAPMLMTKAKEWAGDDAFKQICLTGFEEDLRKIQEWHITMSLLYPNREALPLHHAKHESQHMSRCTGWMTECYQDMLDRGANDVPRQTSVPKIDFSDQDGAATYSKSPVPLIIRLETSRSEAESQRTSLTQISTALSNVDEGAYRASGKSHGAFDPEMNFLLLDSKCVGDPPTEREVDDEEMTSNSTDTSSSYIDRIESFTPKFPSYASRSGDPPAWYFVDAESIDSRESDLPAKLASCDEPASPLSCSSSPPNPGEDGSMCTKSATVNLDQESESRGDPPSARTAKSGESELFLRMQTSESNHISEPSTSSDPDVVRKIDSKKDLCSAQTSSSQLPNTTTPGKKALAHWMAIQSRFK